MAKEKKLVEAITPMDKDFTQWYTDVVTKAELSSAQEDMQSGRISRSSQMQDLKRQGQRTYIFQC